MDIKKELQTLKSSGSLNDLDLRIQQLEKQYSEDPSILKILDNWKQSQHQIDRLTG